MPRLYLVEPGPRLKEVFENRVSAKLIAADNVQEAADLWGDSCDINTLDTVTVRAFPDTPSRPGPVEWASVTSLTMTPRNLGPHSTMF